MRNVLGVFLFALLGTPTAWSEETASALDLLNSAQRALGQVVSAAETDTSLDRESAKGKPFWEALRNLNDSLNKTITSAKLKSDVFFDELATATAAVDQADIARTMNGGGSLAVSSNMGTLSGIVQTLNDNYSREAARLKQGGELSGGERQQLEKLKAQQAELEKKLKEVEEKAATNSADIQAGIEKIRKNSRRIRNAGNTAGDFVGAMLAARFMYGWIWGWHWWWGPWGVWGPGWIDSNIDIWVIGWNDFIYDWDLLDVAVDVSDLGLDSLVIEDAALAEMDSYLNEVDFTMDDRDMTALTEDLPMGWDDISTDVGHEAMDQMESNFEQVPFARDFEVHSIDDVGVSDFGGGFDDF